ncbi:MAG TPA: polyprenol phosphomannose-dependent alpha 1,6 mannosyltransferase MptB [Solirubrobacterales bacterium]|nr:polyprenol phosphomannose-dependent alpha 1,6 mannosyltransferase MptB [Solirubrobacterales bacterium]
MTGPGRVRRRRVRSYPSISRITANSIHDRPLWGAIVVLVTGFALAPVLLSHDVYSYVDYARLGVVHGLDPYVYPPAAAPFDPAYARVTWIDATSAYGPLFTLATYPLAWLPVSAAVAALKATAALSVLGTTIVISRIAPTRGVSPLGAAAFVALNPLVLIHVVGGAHNDGLAMLLATLGIAAMLTARESGAGAAFAAAFAIKAPAAIAAPFALLSASRMKPCVPQRGPKASFSPATRMLAGAGVAALMLATAAYAAFGWNWLDAIGLAGENQHRTSHMSIPISFARLTGLDPTPVRATALALYGALVLYLLIRTWQGKDWLRNAAWASLGLLLATAWLLPWYLIWALPLVALSRDRPLQLLTLALTAYQLPARMPL